MADSRKSKTDDKDVIEKADSELNGIFNRTRNLVKSSINRTLIFFLLLLIVMMIAFVIYHVAVVQSLDNEYWDRAEELNRTRENYLQCVIDYDEITQDIKKYDEIYSETSRELEYSRETSLLELYHRIAADTSCIPITYVDYGERMNLTLVARGSNVESWPYLHVFLDGDYIRTLEVDSSDMKEYSFQVGTYDTTHFLDFVFTDNYHDAMSDRYRKVEIGYIEIDGQRITPDKGYHDLGQGWRSFDCSNKGLGRSLVEEGALRFDIRK